MFLCRSRCWHQSRSPFSSCHHKAPLCTSSYVSTYSLPVTFLCSFLALATVVLPVRLLSHCYSLVVSLHNEVSVFMPFTVLASVTVSVFLLSSQCTPLYIIVCFYVFSPCDFFGVPSSLWPLLLSPYVSCPAVILLLCLCTRW